MWESKEKQGDFSLVVRHKESACESKEKQGDFFFNQKIYIIDIVIDLIIVKLFIICPMIFPSMRKCFPRKYLYFCLWLLFGIGNISDTIWDPISGIRA